MGKVVENIVFKPRYAYFVLNNLITNNQSGFRPLDSTVNQLLDLINDIDKSFDNRKSLEIRAVFLDISEAFDNVWHEGLISKLKQNGVSSTFEQLPVLDSSSSDFLPIESAVTQGSILGPLLFLILINDLEANIQSKIKVVANDFSIRT